MFAKLVIITFILFAITETNAKCKNGQDETICFTVRCANVETCESGKHLVLRDPENCICCNYCEDDKG